MRKFYSIIVTALLTFVSMSANAINITVNVDNPSRVSISVNYGAPLENIVAGDNAITVNEYESVQIKGRFYKFNLSLANSQNLIKATANVILLSQI